MRHSMWMLMMGAALAFLVGCGTAAPVGMTPPVSDTAVMNRDVNPNPADSGPVNPTDAVVPADSALPEDHPVPPTDSSLPRAYIEPWLDRSVIVVTDGRSETVRLPSRERVVMTPTALEFNGSMIGIPAPLHCEGPLCIATIDSGDRLGYGWRHGPNGCANLMRWGASTAGPTIENAELMAGGVYTMCLAR